MSCVSLPRFDRVQVCSPENGNYLLSFLPGLRGRIDDNRAGIATSRYEFQPNGREPETMLFLGSFRHPPIRKGSIGSRKTCCRPCWNISRTRGW